MIGNVFEIDALRHVRRHMNEGNVGIYEDLELQEDMDELTVSLCPRPQ